MTIEQIKKLVKQYNLSPSKSKGQNFLINDEVVKNIIRVSRVDASSKVLEIGSGFGVLTGELLEIVDKLLVVELDNNALYFIKKKFGGNKKIIVQFSDILKIKNEDIAEQLGGEYHVVANIPYNITSKILRKFTDYSPKPKSMTLMIQKEVAKRISAKPGKMSILATAVQFYSNVSYEFEVQRHFFWPQPKVDSAVVRIVPNSKYSAMLNVTEKEFFRIVKFGFSARRKKLVNNLSAGLQIPTSESVKFLQQVDISDGVRAQELSVQNWVDLANVIFGKKN